MPASHPAIDDADAAPSEQRALTGWVVALFAILMTVMIIWIEYSVLVVDSTSFNSLAPSISSVFMLAIVALFINPLLRLIAPARALSGRQIIMLYSMLMVASPVASIGLVHFMLPSTCSSHYFQTEENKWEEVFGEHRPAWACPQDERVVTEFWESGLTGVPWRAWARPLTLWSLFGAAMFWVMICINLIIRRQWIERERLTFPLVYLPLEMAREEEAESGRVRITNSFLRNPLMWVGFVIAIIPQAFAGLHVYYPQVPNVRVKCVPLNAFFRDPPWNAMGHLALHMYPCLIGFGYLLTTEVAFSVWFFYLFTKLERIAGRVIGWTGVARGGMSAFPFEEHQGVGAWLVLIIFGLAIGRRYYADVFRAAFGAKVSWISDREAGTYRLAIVGAVLGLLGMIVFAAYIGLQAVVGTVFFALFFIFVTALARIRAEAGLGCISGPLTLQDVFVTAVGTEAIGAQNLTALQHFHWHTVEFRGAATLMPCQLESLKMADESKIRPREMAAGITLAILFTIVVATYVTMNVVYQHGGVTLNRWRFIDVPVTPYKRLASWLSSPSETDWLSLTFTAIGGASMALLTYMRINHVWWPFHPIGFAVAMTKRTVHWTWFPTLIAWALKTTVLRYGGFKLYRTFVPLFLGLVLGDFFIGGVFGLAGALIPRQGYCVFP